MSHFDSSDEELRDEEYPDEADADWDPNDGDADDETATVECPACGADVYEESEQCPVCGEYISPNTSPLAGRSIVFVFLGIVGIVATIWVLLRLS